MRGLLRLGLVALVAGLLVPAASQANHIAVAALVGVPDAPGTGVVHFLHVEKESGNCCGGGPTIEFGDETFACLCDVTINQYTDPGTYSATLYDGDFHFLGSFPYTVAHVAVPPLEPDQGLNTEITFDHTYDAAGMFTVKWGDCCFGTPQVPEEVPDPVRGILQDTIDPVWGDSVQPTLQDVEDVEPAGIDAGTTYVLAL
jgi:hypothetical protein